MTEAEAQAIQTMLGPQLAGEMTEIVPAWREMEPEAVMGALAAHKASLGEQMDEMLDLAGRLDADRRTD